MYGIRERSELEIWRFVQFPAMVSVIDHQPGHPPVYTDVLTGDEPGPVRAKEEHQVCNILRVSDPSCRMLHGIRSFIFPVLRIDPSGRYGIDTDEIDQFELNGVVGYEQKAGDREAFWQASFSGTFC